MAKVKLGELRESEAGYHLYRQPSYAGDMITVRRKLAMPSDVEHKSSRATQAQRQRFARASQRWSSIPSVIRADLSKKYGLVWKHHSPGLSTTDVLTGRQLFMSQEIHDQEYHDKHAELPPYACIVLVDEAYNPLDGYLKLDSHTQTDLYKIKLSPANFLFPAIPAADEPYIPFGAYEGYYDPGGIILSEAELIRYRYHKLIFGQPPPQPYPGQPIPYWFPIGIGVPSPNFYFACERTFPLTGTITQWQMISGANKIGYPACYSIWAQWNWPLYPHYPAWKLDTADFLAQEGCVFSHTFTIPQGTVQDNYNYFVLVTPPYLAIAGQERWHAYTSHQPP